MLYRVAADLVMVSHFLFIVFVVFGGLLVLRWEQVAWVHLPCAVYGVVISWVGWVCPLTPLENSLRQMAGQHGYEAGFVEHYLLPIIYPSGLTPDVQIVLGALVIASNVAIYAFVAYRR
jgi:hypothetical protein